MSLFIGIILAVLVFFVVVFLHEMGHFLVARWSRVRVMEFGIGIPPRLKRIFRDKHGTEWTLNWLPLGGFVRLKGEDIASPESRDNDALPMSPWWKQVAILLAGVTMNFILAGLIFAGLFFVGTEPLTLQIRESAPQSLLSQIKHGTTLIPIFDTFEDAKKAGVIVESEGVLLDPLPDSPAARAGILRGDVVVRVDNNPIRTPEDIPALLAQKNASYEVLILREGAQRTITVIPEKGKIGAYIAPNITLVRYRYGLVDSLFYGFKEVGSQISFSLRTFGAIITTSLSSTATQEQKDEATAGIGGPVAIGRVFVGIADHGVALRALFVMTAMISLSLGVFNLLPFPALDGGRCLLVVVNQVIHIFNPRFKISPKIEQMIHSVGFIILILASILITYKDIFFH